MTWAFLGILIGTIIGLTLNFSIPIELTKYTAVIIMGVLDALFGAIRAETSNDQFDGIIFITGLGFNIVLSVLITVLGDKLGLDLYLAAAFVFPFRFFTNVGAPRRYLLDHYLAKTRKTG